ncbi:hypothetical protein TKK_0000619 [Trichogramma kaykai]
MNSESQLLISLSDSEFENVLQQFDYNCNNQSTSTPEDIFADIDEWMESDDSVKIVFDSHSSSSVCESYSQFERNLQSINQSSANDGNRGRSIITNIQHGIFVEKTADGGYTTLKNPSLREEMVEQSSVSSTQSNETVAVSEPHDRNCSDCSVITLNTNSPRSIETSIETVTSFITERLHGKNCSDCSNITLDTNSTISSDDAVETENSFIVGDNVVEHTSSYTSEEYDLTQSASWMNEFKNNVPFYESISWMEEFKNNVPFSQ